MSRAFSLTLGGDQYPWTRGLNTAKRPAEMAPNEAQAAESVDASAGTLRGAFGPGTAITATVSVGAKMVHHVAGSTWLSSVYPDRACGLSANNQAIATQYTSDTAYTYPLLCRSDANFRLGLPEPGAGMTITAGARSGDRSYCIAYANPLTTVAGETPYSNPSSILTAKSGATLNSIPQISSPTTYASSGLQIVVYATEEGSPDGPLYYYEQLSHGTSSWTDTGGQLGTYAVDTDQPLNWAENGSIDNETTPYDYSPPPSLSVVAEDLYGASAESGILFAAWGALVVWSHTGKLWAWPTRHRHNVQDPVEAIINYQGSAFALTTNSIWSFSGGADYAISPQRLSGAHPIKKGFGKTAKATPWGILYVAREGLALFDGVQSRVVTKGILDPLTWLDGVTYANAAYFDGAYRLNLWGAGVVLVVELGDDGVKVTTVSGLDAADLPVAPNESSQPGLFVANKTTGALNPWRPADGSAVTGASRQAWGWTTAALALGAASRLKHFERMRVACALGGGTLALDVTARDVEGVVVDSHTQVITSASNAEFWLPSGMTGHTVDVELTPSSGTVELYELTIEGEVLDAA